MSLRCRLSSSFVYYSVKEVVKIAEKLCYLVDYYMIIIQLDDIWQLNNNLVIWQLNNNLLKFGNMPLTVKAPRFIKFVFIWI